MRLPTMLATATIAAGFLSSALPLVANAQSAPAKTIDVVRYAVDPGLQPNTSEGEAAPGFIKISFVNRGAVPATAVRFVVESSHEPDAVIDDVGRFSPGILINHRFQHDSFSPDATVHISEVRYADGSRWSEDDIAPMTERRQALGR